MLNKKCFGAVILAAAAVSPSAFAGDRGVNTAVGAVLGAAIGHSAGGSGGAVVGGVLGAAVGNSIGGHDDRRYGGRGYASVDYYQPAPVYVQPQPVYYEQPRPVYYEQPRYYRGSTVVYVEPRHRHHNRGWDRDDRRGRDWDRGHDRGWDRDGYRR
ncbi:hypothetical protein G4G28_10765 [Massilia sp. Dwa41.01b]|uniref:glycine zipper domain-containing protein n=1 Tax=unclassified Massilia TaxID=2609279 RepID=UPI001600C825|nr:MULTISPECIES: glycine zipper domain-containing protein [unclassified Massilia]QNA88845.1 hypothetical protein G4G28_10765 [Massilia sp. Dwa41.01b]QNA99734.1 hypothetical protein G4G31_14395 [Massilia sp. Se16.2.3]